MARQFARTPRAARAARAALVLAAGLLFAGCRVTLEPPPDFVELEERDWSSYAYRAADARGVVLGVRAERNPERGTLEFWVEVLKGRLRADRGYALLEENPVTASNGVRGRTLVFGRDEGHEPYLFAVTAFVTGSDLYLVEWGGKKLDVERARAGLDAAVTGFAP